uniref:Conserved secreted protein n=1 Tax=Panagrellus redivivus TaxID=6233 RepID=A0A7E4UQ66_PANRE
MLSQPWILFIFASAIGGAAVIADVPVDETDKTEVSTPYQGPAWLKRIPDNLNAFAPDELPLYKRPVGHVSRNPYSWMATNTPSKRSRNPYAWLALAEDSASKRAYYPTFDKKSRNPYSWMSDVKRARNPYAWVNYV